MFLLSLHDFYISIGLPIWLLRLLRLLRLLALLWRCIYIRPLPFDHSTDETLSGV
jgi:hypothetical protein